MIIPNALASHDSDKQWGTVSVDKPVLEIPYTTADNSQYKKIKIFGTVEEPRSSGYVFMTFTEPDGKTYQTKIKPNGSYGNYENFILICCNKAGTYSVYVEWRGYHIGTVAVDVIQKPKPTESLTVIPDWIKNNARWWADGQFSDLVYLAGIQFLVEKGIIVVPQTDDTDFQSADSQKVPVWLKNNARWWADGQINDIAYISGIQHLIKVGIIKVS